jgi:predicted RNase H-like nuclease (RuvC/YqgF family)
MISLVDNMVKLGSSMSPQRHKRLPKPETSTAVKRNLTPMLHQQQQQQQQQLQHQQQQQIQQPKFHSSPYEPPAYSNVQQRNSTMVFHSTPHRPTENDANEAYGSAVQGWEEAQISQLESKHHQLAQLEKFVREEGAAIHRLTRNQQVLRLAIRGIRQQTNTALQVADYGEVERCRQQQLFLERELSQIHSLLALSSKRLEDAAVEISRIEREISSLHQQLHRLGANNRQHHQSGGGHSLSRSNNGREMAWLEAELNRVQQHVSQLQTRRQELSSQVNCLTSADYFLDLDESFSSTGSTKRKPPSTW